MKPHPRIRKTVKWGGAVVSVILLVAWVGSGWWNVGRFCSNNVFVVVSRGVVLVGWPNRRMFEDPAAGWGMVRQSTQMLWWPMWRNTGSHLRVWIPIWPVAGLSLLATAAAWRLDALARRRARLGLCPKCNYNRAGLPPQTVCPECGAAPSIAPSN